MKGSSREAKEMEEVLFGGQTAAGTRAISKMGCRVEREFCSGMEATKNTKEHGITECLMAEEFSTFRTENDMKEALGRISSKEMGSFIRKIQ